MLPIWILQSKFPCYLTYISFIHSKVIFQSFPLSPTKMVLFILPLGFQVFGLSFPWTPIGGLLSASWASVCLHPRPSRYHPSTTSSPCSLFRSAVLPPPPFIRDEINNAINKSIWESRNCQGWLGHRGHFLSHYAKAFHGEIKEVSL